MTTNFPTSVDAFTNPTSNDTLDNPPHDQQHTDINDAMEAVQTSLLDGAPLHIDDANERVGIGTTSPAQPLHVKADVYGMLALDRTANANVDQKVILSPTYQAAGETAFSIQIGSEVMRLTESGNVGIATTSPSYKLDVNGDINATGDVRVGGVAINGNLISGATYYTTNNSQYAPEYGSNYYRSNLYTISAPSGKSISNVVLTPQPYTPYNPAWITLTAVSSSSYSYYVYSKGASAGNVRYFLDCR